MSWNELPFNSKSEAVEYLKDNHGIEESKAEQVAELIEREVEFEDGNPQSLLEGIKDGAKEIISQLGLGNFSFVDVPAQRSQFVMMKSKDAFQTNAPIMKEEGDDWEVVYAPVMQAGEKDKQGDSVPAHVIRDSAHDFLENKQVDNIDSDHDLIENKGVVVESWIEKEDKTYELPNGESFKVNKGSWMAGVKPSDDVKQRIEDGELNGFSIYGRADKIELSENDKSLKSKEDCNTVIEGLNMDKDDVEKQFESLKENLEVLKEELSEVKEDIEEVSEPEPDFKEVSSVEELKEAIDDGEAFKADLDNDVLVLETEKEASESEIKNVLNTLTPERVSEKDVEEHVKSLFEKEEEEYEEDEEEEEEEEEEAKQKGANEENVRKEQIEQKNQTKSISFMDKIRESQ